MMNSSSIRQYGRNPAPPPPPPPLAPPSQPSIHSIKSATLRQPNEQQKQQSSPPQQQQQQLGPFSRSRSTGNLCRQQSGNQPNPIYQTVGQPKPVPVPVTSQLSDSDLEKIEMFYRSHRTHLFVGRCLVNLYVTETDLVDGGRISRPRIQDWKLTLTGIPVLIFNKGDTKSRDKRQIQICLAERGTGFPLWSDIIDSLSSYAVTQPTFHTMYLSFDHRKMAGLSFDCPVAAVQFFHQIEPIITNPLNIALDGPKKGKSRLMFRRKRSKSVGRQSRHETNDPFTTSDSSSKLRTPPNKADISSPCLFQHVTSVNMYNREELPSVLTAFVPPHQSFTDSDRSTSSSHYSTPEPIDSAITTTNTITTTSTNSHGTTNGQQNLRLIGSYGDLHLHHHHHHSHHSDPSGSSSSASNFSY